MAAAHFTGLLQRWGQIKIACSGCEGPAHTRWAEFIHLPVPTPTHGGKPGMVNSVPCSVQTEGTVRNHLTQQTRYMLGP